MNNLFVLHTQYNLLLAIGLCKSEFMNDENNLILFTDFNLTENHREIIQSVFHKCLILQGAFPKVELSGFMKYKRISADIDRIDEFIDDKYDRVFIVLDMCIQEMYVMKCAYNSNPDTRFCWLEDGATAYYHNGVISGGMGATPVKRFLRQLFFSSLFGLGSFYDLQEDTGMHKKLSELYVIYPEYVLNVYKTKQRIQISEESFFQGMKWMYEGERCFFPENSIILAMDLTSNYGKNRGLVEEAALNYIKTTAIDSPNVFVKYHPRENQPFEKFKQFTELDRTRGIESYLTNSTTKNLTVIGVMSTALLSAKKMGYNVVSLADSTGFYNKELSYFYEKIGVVNK